MTGTEFSDEVKQTLIIQLDNYYRTHISLGDFVAFIAEDGSQIIAAAYLVIMERPAGASFMSGITGMILNVITYPEYRKNGYATLLIKHLIHKGEDLNVAAIDLNATPMGRGVYQNLDFESVKDIAMRMTL